ncbi:hypothetical protein MTR_1g057640 [Medicago truncatula]|uniref:Uncharacterized protein n=1 Tax=Medicago truncatula TaxID=3880 RepID=A0A072VK04_MEDTR|nr:hypothetical protein MTR_1g057640 [Medicago truncatula]
MERKARYSELIYCSGFILKKEGSSGDAPMEWFIRNSYSSVNPIITGSVLNLATNANGQIQWNKITVKGYAATITVKLTLGLLSKSLHLSKFSKLVSSGANPNHWTKTRRVGGVMAESNQESKITISSTIWWLSRADGGSSENERVAGSW